MISMNNRVMCILFLLVAASCSQQLLAHRVASNVKGFTKLAIVSMAQANPCQAGEKVGKTLARSYAEFVVAQKQDLTKGKQLLMDYLKNQNTKIGMLDSSCVVRGFDQSYLIFYEHFHSKATKSNKQEVVHKINDHEPQCSPRLDPCSAGKKIGNKLAKSYAQLIAFQKSNAITGERNDK